MVKTSSDPFEDLRKTMLTLQAATKPIVEIHKGMQETMKPIVQFSKSLQEQLGPIQKQLNAYQTMFEPMQKLGNVIVERIKQLKQDFADTIYTIEPPLTYDPSKIKLDDRIHDMALDMVVFVDDMEKNELCYLQKRMLIGIDAHLKGNYHLSLFCIFSTIEVLS